MICFDDGWMMLFFIFLVPSSASLMFFEPLVCFLSLTWSKWCKIFYFSSLWWRWLFIMKFIMKLKDKIHAKTRYIIVESFFPFEKWIFLSLPEATKPVEHPGLPFKIITKTTTRAPNTASWSIFIKVIICCVQRTKNHETRSLFVVRLHHL